jgi:hypothetical protein
VSSVQLRLVVVATLLSESVWLYALTAVLGVMFGVGANPLTWTAVVVLLALSYIVARGIAMVAMPITVAYALQMIAGATVVYVMMGTQADTGVGGLDLGWAAHLSATQDELGPAGAVGNLRGALLGVMVSVGLWWRGGRTASLLEPLENLEAGFRIGLASLAVATTLDIFNGADLNIFPVMFLFFASGLVGLSIGHLLPASRTATEERAWTRVIAGVVAAILVAGLMLSLLGRSVLSWVSTPILTVLGWLATVVLYIVVLPIAFVADWLTRLGIYLVGLIGAEEDDPEQQGRSLAEQIRDLQEREVPEWPGMLLQALEYLVIAIVAIALLYIMARAFRRRYRLRRTDAGGVHESVREDADPAYDLARLLFNLLPSRLRRVTDRRTYRLPDDESGVVDVFRIYFGMLTLAEERGHPRPAAETPAEYQRTLEGIFPGDLVRRVTAAFNRACYGHRAASPNDIAEMRTALDRLQSASG